MKKYRAVVKCGIGFESLEVTYEKKWNIVVVDNNPDLSELKDPEVRLNLKEQNHKRYQMKCKYCGKTIFLPHSEKYISTDSYAHAAFNKSDFQHDVQVISIDPVIRETDEVINVTGNPSISLVSEGVDRGTRQMDTLEGFDNVKRVEFFVKVVIGLLILNAILKFAEIILKLNHP